MGEFILYVVGRWRDGAQWEFSGVFEDPDDALESCLTEDYFVAAIRGNEQFPDETIVWPGLFYPAHADPPVEWPGVTPLKVA